jgi:polyisoprenyl-phosphate glycosyltransferase
MIDRYPERLGPMVPPIVPAMLRLSIVAPCHNEATGLAELHRRVSIVARAVAGEDYELVLVNDGSSDHTWEVMRNLVASDPRAAAVNLSRRHGHQLALTAGLSLCRGERILTIDSDLQDPPELLVDMWRLMNSSSADVVYGQRRERPGETLFKRGTAAILYRLLRRIGYGDLPVDTGDFRLMTRRVVRILNGMPERHRFIRGMVSWIGLRQVPISYERSPRRSGSSSYPFARMIGLALDAITSFSIVPLRIASLFGLFLGAFSLLMLAYTLGSWGLGRAVDGWTSLTTIVLVLGSMQLFLFGILGEYVGRLYLETKQRPLFVIDRVITQNAEMQNAEIDSAGAVIAPPISDRLGARPVPASIG